MRDLTINIIRGCAKSLSDGIASFERRSELGIQEGQFQLLIQSDRWLANDIPEIRAVLHEVLGGTQTLAGLQNTGIVLAEEAATVVAALVSPVNWQVAANIVRGSVSGSAIMRAAEADHPSGHVRVSEERLRAMVYFAYSRVLERRNEETFAQIEKSPEDKASPAGPKRKASSD